MPLVQAEALPVPLVQAEALPLIVVLKRTHVALRYNSNIYCIRGVYGDMIS